MSEQLAQEYYAASCEEFTRLVARLRADVEAYAAKPDANTKRINIQNEIIAKCLTFLNASNAAIQELDKTIQYYKTQHAEAYKRGREDGVKEAEAAPDRWANKEAFRAYHIARQKEKWSDHF